MFRNFSFGALFLVGSLLLLPGVVCGQIEPPPPPAGASQPVPDVVGNLPDGFETVEETAAQMRKKVADAYFDVTPGFDTETTEASPSLSVTSRIARAFDFRPPSEATRWCSFGVFDGKGEWSEAEAARNHVEAALSGTIHYCKVTRTEGNGPQFIPPPVVFGLTADLRSKWGTFSQGEGEQQQTVEGSQLILGAGLTTVVYRTPDWLELEELTAAYYRVLDTEGDLPIPEGLDIDHLQARVKSRLFPFGYQRPQNPLRDFALVVDGRASWALDGPDEGEVEYYTSLALEMGKDKMVASLRWENGKEVGFDYDQRLVVGILFRLLGGAAGSGN